MTNRRQPFYPADEILAEVDRWLSTGRQVDVITIVGEGEPTLYADLEPLIHGIQAMTDLPVAVITNGALLYDPDVAGALMAADLVLPSVDAPDEELYHRINCPHGSLRFEDVIEGLRTFSRSYRGKLWIETMLLGGINDSDEVLHRLRRLIDTIDHERLFLNTPVRPPAESDVEEPPAERMQAAMRILGGTAINQLLSEGFASDIADPVEAVLSIIRRHPMNQYEIRSFFDSREEADPDGLLAELDRDPRVRVVTYKGYKTYR